MPEFNFSYKPWRSFASKLLMSHLWIALAGLAIIIAASASTLMLNARIRSLAGHGAPIAQISTRILAEVNRSLALLRGCTSLGGSCTAGAWQNVWSQGIDPAVGDLLRQKTVFVQFGIDGLIKNLPSLLEDLRESQWWVREAARAPGNEPARMIYRQEVEPIAAEMEACLTALAKYLGSKSDSLARDERLGYLNQARLHLNIAYLNLEKYLANGSYARQQAFFNMLHEIRKDIKAAGLETWEPANKRSSWHRFLMRDLNALDRSARSVVKLRTSPAWNLGRYRMETETIPISDKIVSLASELAVQSTSRMETLSVKAGHGLVWTLGIQGGAAVLMLTVMFLISRRQVRAMTRPVLALSDAARRFADGHLEDDIPVSGNDELSDLTRSFNSMRNSLANTQEALHQAYRRLEQRDKRRTAALAESQERLQLIADTLPILISQIDKDNRYLYANREYQRWFGLEPADIIGRRVPEVIGERGYERVASRIDRAFTGEAQSFEERLILPNGEPRFLQFTYIPHRSDREQVDSIFIMAQDISERRQTEQALQESERRFRTLVDSAPDGILIFDTGQDRVVEANPSVCRLLGYTRKDLLGKSWLDISPARQHDGNLAEHRINRMLRAALEGKSVLQEWLFNHFNGTEVLTEMRLNRMDEGARRLVRASLTDISERRQLLLQLQQAQKMEAVGTLAGGIAHEFNNVLGIIIGNTELALMDTAQWSPTRSNLEAIKQAGFRARDVVQGLLSFSRKTDQRKKWIDISPIVKESLKLLRSSIPAQIEIVQDISSLSCTVLANSTQIHQVMINLCTNAAHAMEQQGGKLEVALHPVVIGPSDLRPHAELPAGRFVHLAVKDNGVGIAPEHMERIFDPFFTTKEVNRGTGMGLAVVHGIVTDHNGYIFVQSKPGQGSWFEIYFPSYEYSDEVSKEHESQQLAGGSEHILFVDDEIYIVEIAEQILKRLGYTVTTATDPVQALALLQADPQRFDLLITDMAMPRMSGEALARQALELRRNLPVILNTGYSDRLDAEKAHAMGIRKYLHKPLDSAQLALVVREVLDGQGA